MLTFRTIEFDDLRPSELHAVLRARQDVFVVEQACIFPEIDGWDPAALHVLGEDATGELMAYLRILGPGTRCSEPSLGRVLTTAQGRGKGFGKAIMAVGIEHAARLHPEHPIRVSAQAHLLPFYGQLGFEPIGDPYDEDGIAHQDMVRPLDSAR